MSDETYVCQCADSTAIPGHPSGHHPWCPFYPKETTEAAPTQVFLNTTPFGETDILERLAALEERMKQVDEVADVAFNRSNFLGDEIDKLTERVEKLEDKDNLRHLGLNDLTKRVEKLVNALYQMSLDMSLITGKEWMPDTPEPKAPWYNTPDYWHEQWVKADAHLEEAEALLKRAVEELFPSSTDKVRLRKDIDNFLKGGDADAGERRDSPDVAKAGECSCGWNSELTLRFPVSDCPIHGTPGPQDRSG